MEMGIDIFIKRDEFIDFHFIKDFIETKLDFTPNQLNFKTVRGKKWKEVQNLEAIFIEDTLFVTGSKSSFTFSLTNHVETFAISNGYETSTGNEILLLSKYLNTEHFLVAYNYHKDFVYSQGEENIDNLTFFGVDFTKYNVISKDDYPYKKVDISKNPGRLKWNDKLNIDVGACWKMWFSRELRLKFTGKPMEKFPEAYKIEMLHNDILFVQLYERVEDSETMTALDKMHKFRDWVAMDKLMEP
ncbi:MAG: hypothetical protein V4722_08695 [Bacteroidota bacterium]